MKKCFLATAVILFSFCFGTAQTKAPEWKELKQFHALMSASFHPAEEGNFAPLKQNSDSLVIAAVIWSKSTIPADYKPTETKETLEQLTVKCKQVQKAVKENKDDAALKKLISEAHDVFHKIVEVCKKNE